MRSEAIRNAIHISKRTEADRVTIESDARVVVQDAKQQFSEVVCEISLVIQDIKDLVSAFGGKNCSV
nr:hypothetical protein CFP56_56752 [Quercus suber]